MLERVEEVAAATYARFVRTAERLVAVAPPLASVYSTLHMWIVRAEARAAGIEEHTRVLCVGGGVVPHTAIRIAIETGARVDVVDNRIDVIVPARSVIGRLGSLKVHVMHADGLTCNLSGYDVVCVAATVAPKQELLKRIVRDAPEEARIVFRQLSFVPLSSLGEAVAAAERIAVTLPNRAYLSWRLPTSNSYLIRAREGAKGGGSSSK